MTDGTRIVEEVRESMTMRRHARLPFEGLTRLACWMMGMALMACSPDPEPVPDDADVEVSEIDDSTDGDALECPDGRVERVVDGVVVDPCGCCRLDEWSCSMLTGGSPEPWGGCDYVYDAAPPCTEGVDRNGCPFISCSGSCIGGEDDAW